MTMQTSNATPAHAKNPTTPAGLDARLAAAGAIVFGLGMTALIALTDVNLARFVTPAVKTNPFDYIWRLSEPTAFTRAVVWLSYLAHQLVSWGVIWHAQRARTRYTRALHPVNLCALAANGLFVFWHWVQTQWTYDGLAQDVSVLTSQGSVVILLIIVLAMETPRRGLFFGKRVPFRADFIQFLKKYHGYFFSWALVYTFWYHPAVSTQGHLVGFMYMFILLIQSSLFFTTLHVDRRWTFALEFLVLPHGVLVALQQGNNLWPMFFNGFLGIFFVTQLHGLGLSARAKSALAALWVVSNLAIFLTLPDYLATLPRVLLAIPLIDYVGVFLLYGIFLLVGGVTRRLKGAEGAPVKI